MNNTFRAEPGRASAGIEHYMKDYSFSSDWFTMHIPVWKKHLNAFRGKPGIKYLEIGVY